MTWTIVHENGMHVVPLLDLRDHEAVCDCWCGPTQDGEWPNIWTHHALDQREKYETGELKLQ